MHGLHVRLLFISGPVPDAVMEAMVAAEVMWVPGLRVLDPRCGVAQSQGNFLRSTISNVRLQRQCKEIVGHTFRFVELFAGVGGFRMGMERLGGQCVFASELDREARAAYTVRSRVDQVFFFQRLTGKHRVFFAYLVCSFVFFCSF